MNTIKTPSSILVGMSGGVDSSVAAYLLKEAGHRVQGVFMKNWEGDDTDTYCNAAEDIKDAQAVCDLLQIPLHTVNFSDQYWERVFSYFLDEYRKGRTPNPDILCNKEIKFFAFLDYAKQRGADFIATGHYARIRRAETQLHLLKGLDPTKDQSYFLCALNQSQLKHSLFPVGELSKQAVRELAKKIGLSNHAKKDSTGICFIGERKFKTFLQQYLPAQPGPILSLEGEELGQHDGLLFYTLGQRQGLHIGGKKGKSELPWYVVKKDIERHILFVTQGSEHPALYQPSLTASNLHWINEAPQLPLACYAKTRYRQADQACVVERMNDTTYLVTFTEPQRAITPGQSVVFYQDEVCLGGGMIEQ